MKKGDTLKIAASILDLNPKTRETLEKIEESGIDFVHIDVMDGKFVSNESFPYEQVSKFINSFHYDIHLMVENPKEYIEDYSKIKPEYITFHYEIGSPLEWIKLIQSKGIKAGMSIKPSTTVEEIKPYLPYLDLVLVMSVEPGLGGQVFLESTYSKIEELIQYKKEYNNSFQIEVDGGINSSNIENLKKCDIIVVGSFITKGVFKERVEELKKCCNLEET